MGSSYREFIGALVIAIASASTVLAQDVAAQNDKAECDAANRRSGKLDLNGYLKCRDGRDRAIEAADKKSQDEARQQKLDADGKSPDQRKKDSAECQLSNRFKDASLNVTAFAKCISERDKTASEKEAAERQELSQKLANEAAQRAANDEAKKAETTREADAAYAAWKADNDRQERAFREQEEARARAEEQLQAKCGRDYGVVKVGMSFARVNECAGPFSAVGANGARTVYDNGSVMVGVEHGVVINWVSK